MLDLVKWVSITSKKLSNVVKMIAPDDVREAIKLDSELGDAVKDSMATLLIQVGQRFLRMKMKDVPLNLVCLLLRL